MCAVEEQHRSSRRCSGFETRCRSRTWRTRHSATRGGTTRRWTRVTRGCVTRPSALSLPTRVSWRVLTAKGSLERLPLSRVPHGFHFPQVGVRCAGGHVESIVLQKLRLHGTLPEFQADQFPQLRVLSVSNNALRGTIPTSVGLLTALSQLHMVRAQRRAGLKKSLGEAAILIIGRGGRCEMRIRI
jgi:hypothetical protein